MSSVLPQQTESTAAAQPRRLTLRTVSIALVVIGLFITGYLSYTHLTNAEVACVQNSSIFNCEDVNSSIYSEFMGIYVGYLGLAADIFLLIVLVAEPRIELLQVYGVVIVFAVVLLAWLYHDYLTYVSFTRIHELCPWCLTEHTIMTILLIITGVRLYRTFFGAQAAAA